MRLALTFDTLTVAALKPALATIHSRLALALSLAALSVGLILWALARPALTPAFTAALIRAYGARASAPSGATMRARRVCTVRVIAVR